MEILVAYDVATEDAEGKRRLRRLPTCASPSANGCKSRFLNAS